jgi:hypothetical protein
MYRVRAATAVFRPPRSINITFPLTPLFSIDFAWRAPCHIRMCSAGGALMWILVNLAMLVLATLITGAAAVAVYWLLLRATVEMMRPAAPTAAPRERSIAPAGLHSKKGASKCWS